ncbi:MATE family efflux transporter [Novosphingobium sp. FSY-8]|uniref:MATE family efflux transporter n=1 Tax=Novosphingobium ovatum TaxID=1908523 RepID=A0ABW9XE21_9SPHN|nr:MATE family efflux transporter [Novosphingobium ovatum]NBC36769.1 MATE family efflux transporter [Novosphingobium ovatum]
MSETYAASSVPDDSPQDQPHPAAGRMRGDLTEGPILKTLMLFSIPTLISNMLQTLNGTINSIWVGRLIGESALAATANANIVMFLTFAAVFGFGMATTVRVGQNFGARKIDAARITFGSGIGFCTLVSIVVGLIGFVYSPALLTALGTPELSRIEALEYLRVVFITMPFGTLSVMVSMGLRGAGDAKTPLYAMILTVIIDILCNPLLIRGVGPIPAMGITGSALSTAIANFAGVAFMIAAMYLRDMPLRLRGAELGYLVPRRSELGFIITKGLPMGTQMLLVSSAGLIMISLVNAEGMETAAAYGASLQLWNYLQMPAFAISSAVSAMVAQNVGAGKHRRVSQITWQGLGANLALTGTLAVVLVVAAHPLLGLFLGPQSAALPLAEHMQRIVTWSFVLMGVMMILTGTMRAYGAVLMPLVIMFISLYPARLGFYYIAHTQIGAEAIWWSYPFGSVVAAGLTLVLYNRKGWRKIDRSKMRSGSDMGGGEMMGH